LGALATLLVTLTLTAGFASLAIGALNLVSIAFAVLLVGLGLDYAIHLLMHVREHRLDGRNVSQALLRSVREVGGALALCVPTTALAFLAFTPTPFEGMAQLGMISAAGVVIAFFATVTLLPAILTVAPGAKVRQPVRGERPWARRLAGGVNQPLAAITIIAGLAATALMPSVRFDADPMSLRDPSSPSVRAFDLLFEEENSSPYQLQLIAATPEELRAEGARLKALPEVRSVRSIDSFIPENQPEKLELIDIAAGAILFSLDGGFAEPAEPGGAARLLAALEKLEEPGLQARQLASELRALEERASAAPETLDDLSARIFRFWPMQLSRLRQQLAPETVTLETVPGDLKRRFVAEDGRLRLEILPALDVREADARRAFVEAVSAAAPQATGSALTVQRAGETVSKAMVQATLFAAGLVSLLLWVLLRSFAIVALILAPLALAAILTSAAGVLLGLPYNLANVIVLPLLIGLGVDSGIHLVLRQRKLTSDEGVFATSTPRAVFYSALTTIASFGSLSLSAHRGTASMGSLLTVAIAFTLLCTLVVLPAAMNWGNRRGRG
ncbi:MAG: MMPL family transporter, partial [Pseudomonadota bacterium]